MSFNFLLCKMNVFHSDEVYMDEEDFFTMSASMRSIASSLERIADSFDKLLNEFQEEQEEDE